MDPFAVLLAELRQARAAGTPFPDVWPDAVAAAMRVVADEDERDRSALRSALTSTTSAWRAAYAGAPPTPVEKAVARLHGSPLVLPEANTQGERVMLAQRLAAEGKSYYRIGRLLGVSRSTVRTMLTYRPHPPAPRTECSQGHPLEGDNVIVRKYDNARICRTCERESARERTRRYRERKAQATAA